MLIVFVAVGTGVVGWWAVSALLGPLRRIEELRRGAHEMLIFYASIDDTSPLADRDAIRPALRGVASDLITSAEAASKLVQRRIRRRGWDLHEAGTQLRALSTMLQPDVDPDLTVVAVSDVARALCFPPTLLRVRGSHGPLGTRTIDTMSLASRPRAAWAEAHPAAGN